MLKTLTKEKTFAEKAVSVSIIFNTYVYTHFKQYFTFHLVKQVVGDLRTWKNNNENIRFEWKPDFSTVNSV